MLRWLVILATALIVNESGRVGFTSGLVVLLLLGWAVAIYLLPISIVRHSRFEWTLVLSDILLVALSLLYAVPAEPALPAIFFLSILIAVLASGSAGWPVAGLAVPGLYIALTSSSLGSGNIWTMDTAARTAFLLASGYYFLLAMRRINRTADAFQRDRREKKELLSLLQITETITGTLDLKRVMSLIVQKVGERVEAESCSILLTDDKLRNCFVLASKERPEIDMLEIDLDKYPELQQALESREPVLVSDVQSDPLLHSVRDILIEKGYRSMLVLPLLFGKDVLGTLFLRASRERPFTPREIRFCKVAAGASANALKNSMLYREVTRKAEEHRAAGEKLRRVLDCTPDMVVTTDIDGLVTEFSSGAVRMTGVQACDAVGVDLGNLLGLRELMETACGTDRTIRKDVVITQQDGGDREVDLASAPLVSTDGEKTGRVWVGRDMTHVRRVERSLAQAERLSTLGEVVAGVAHELNNPLSAVLGYSELLGKNPESEELENDLRRIVEAAQRCKRIVQNLLGFAREHAPAKKQENLNACVRKVLDLKGYQLRNSKIQTECRLDPDLPSTMFDFHQVEQVIVNLLNNAEHAIRSTKVPGRIMIRSYSSKDMVHLEMEDTGPGIPPGVQARVFDPFFTTKDVGEGTGLGLSVSFGIIREHKGRLEVRPYTAGSGACFVLSLPLVRERIRETSVVLQDHPAESNMLSGSRILVADDEKVVLDLFSRILEQDGAEVTKAMDGEEAWEKLVESDYDLVIADLRMPRLDGRELYERVAEERPELLRRIVFSTGDLVRPETSNFLESLPNTILSKPLQIETVRHVVGLAIKRDSGR